MNCKRCKKPISDHQAGSETDACVAVVVMGSTKPIYPHSHPHINPIYTDDGYWICYPEYKDGDICEWEAIPFSTKIFQAWKVVEKMSGLQLPSHVGPTMLHRLRECSGKGWGVIFCSDFGYKGEFFAPTPELAICRASLEALSR